MQKCIFPDSLIIDTPVQIKSRQKIPFKQCHMCNATVHTVASKSHLLPKIQTQESAVDQIFFFFQEKGNEGLWEVKLHFLGIQILKPLWRRHQSCPGLIEKFFLYLDTVSVSADTELVSVKMEFTSTLEKQLAKRILFQCN